MDPHDEAATQSQADFPELLRRPAERGLLFDEFVVGAALRSAARTVTEADVAAFAGVSGDFNPLHLDEDFARRTTFRRRIAHGLLVESIASGLAFQTGIFDETLVAIQEMRLGYVAPVGIGDTIHCELEVLELQPDPGPKRGWVRLRANVYNASGDPVIHGEWVVLVQRRRNPTRGNATTGRSVSESTPAPRKDASK